MSSLDQNLIASDSNTLLRMEAVNFRYSASDSPVLAAVNFDLSIGEVVAIVGRSGIGKSTLLKLISGELVPSSGVIYRTEKIHRPNAIAHLDQDATLFSWMRVEQIIRLCLSKAGHGDQESFRSIEDALGSFGLAGTERRYPNELSGGMRQRLALAFAVLRRPQMLLLDEPFGSVDEFTKDSLYHLLQAKLKLSETTVVLVTHDVNECLTLSDRVIVLAGSPHATVAREFQVRSPKPRSATLLFEPEFVQLNKSIRSAMRT